MNILTCSVRLKDVVQEDGAAIQTSVERGHLRAADRCEQWTGTGTSGWFLTCSSESVE